MALFRRRNKASNDNVSHVEATLPPEAPKPQEVQPVAAQAKPAQQAEAPAVAVTESKPAGIFVSVIIPVYNSMPYLTELLNSLELQDLDKSLYEVIAVNDGSTDFGGEILDVYAKRNANFTVVHQENSGWPGKPRNVGTSLAKGEYVFYADSDDTLGTEALRRMRDFALEHDVDVLAPKLVPVGGRVIRTSLFSSTQVDVPLEQIFATLMPQKLIRRQMILDHDLRFAEEKVRLEDGMVLAGCYLHAKRVSVLADYEYYYIRERGDGNNISAQPFEPKGYVESMTHISNTIRDNTTDDPELGRKLIAGLFKRKGLKFFVGDRFLKYREARAKLWTAAFGPYVQEFLAERTNEVLSDQDTAKAKAIMAGDYEQLKLLAAKDELVAERPELTKATAKSDHFELHFTSPGVGPTPRALYLDERETERRLQFEVSEQGKGKYIAKIPFAALAAQKLGIGDIHVKYDHAETRRIRVPANVKEATASGVRVYRTIKGALSIDLRKSTLV
ncbi:glycosyltransferase family 2 protein [Arthrobacter sp. NIO-1057]|uniref:glycosyltransferase family 2 protein n=1 Tax=Arthrobacter sp. NIO-1057 TaxID=993071 RepID=UPI0008178009|nr:glycosyltransferase [Arthrobacter sp. NIO-1057]SCB78019.1 Glycosyl transferase family 2 [Arthrobacter sp. NIO-1057]